MKTPTSPVLSPWTLPALLLLVIIPFPEAAVRAASLAAQPEIPELKWHDVSQWGVEGRAWTDLPRKRWYDRFPAEAEGAVTDAVWRISRYSTGMMVRFRADAPAIWAHYSLGSEKLTAPNRTAIGTSGIDLYARDAAGQWRFVGNTIPETREVVQPFVRWSRFTIAPGLREYAAYLPLYNEVEDLSIGVPPGAVFEPLPPRPEKPIVFYGTSITQGASASRPGMLYTAILGRRLDLPVVNLGFGGNGKMHAEVGDLMVKIDAAVYVVDCLPNLQTEEVRQLTVPFVKRLRAARPGVPIVLVESRRYSSAWILPALDRFYDESHAALREAFAQLRQDKVDQIYYIPGNELLGTDSEGTTDVSHPSDLGNMRQADVFEPILRAALGR